MEITAYEVWSEWDLGIPKLYSKREKAEESLRMAVEQGLDSSFEGSYEELIEDGSISIKEIKYY